MKKLIFWKWGLQNRFLWGWQETNFVGIILDFQVVQVEPFFRGTSRQFDEKIRSYPFAPNNNIYNIRITKFINLIL